MLKVYFDDCVRVCVCGGGICLYMNIPQGQDGQDRTYSSWTQRNKLSAAVVRICIRLFVAWATRFPRAAVGG